MLRCAAHTFFQRENKKEKKKRESLSFRRAASLVKVFEAKYYPAEGWIGDFASKPVGPDLEKRERGL